MTHIKSLTSVNVRKGVSEPVLCQGTGGTTSTSGLIEPGPIDIKFVIDLVNAMAVKKQSQTT